MYIWGKLYLFVSFLYVINQPLLCYRGYQENNIINTPLCYRGYLESIKINLPLCYQGYLETLKINLPLCYQGYLETKKINLPVELENETVSRYKYRRSQTHQLHCSHEPRKPWKRIKIKETLGCLFKGEMNAKVFLLKVFKKEFFPLN